MHFIVTTGVDKADEATQKLIRSQVMIGKNRGKHRHTKKRRTTSWAVVADSKRDPPATLDTFIKAYHSAIPGRVGSDISLVNFVAAMSAAECANLRRFFNLVAQALSPLLVVTGFGYKDAAWLNPLKFDAAYLHVTVFAAQVLMDKVLGRQYPTTNPSATAHFLKGVNILRERLLVGDGDTTPSDSTIAVVLTLALTAFFTGEDAAFTHHMVGLRKMVTLRGGMGAFKGNKLLTELFRCDISMAVQNGSKPVFFNDPVLEPIVPYPDQELLSIRNSAPTPSSQVNLGDLPHKMDAGLAEAWSVMQRFCSIVNLAAETKRMLAPTLLYDTMASVMYRLLLMRFDPGSIDEAVRLGLQAVTYNIFLQWQYLRPPYTYFPTIYKRCLLDPKLEDAASSQFMLWMVMIGAVSIFPVSDHPWLKACLRRHLDKCHVTSWDEARGILKSFMWVALLHDKQGKEAFVSALS